jgi:hypothetical protein
LAIHPTEHELAGNVLHSAVIAHILRGQVVRAVSAGDKATKRSGGGAGEGPNRGVEQFGA